MFHKYKLLLNSGSCVLCDIEHQQKTGWMWRFEFVVANEYSLEQKYLAWFKQRKWIKSLIHIKQKSYDCIISCKFCNLNWMERMYRIDLITLRHHVLSNKNLFRTIPIPWSSTLDSFNDNVTLERIIWFVRINIPPNLLLAHWACTVRFIKRTASSTQSSRMACTASAHQHL